MKHIESFGYSEQQYVLYQISFYWLYLGSKWRWEYYTVGLLVLWGKKQDYLQPKSSDNRGNDINTHQKWRWGGSIRPEPTIWIDLPKFLAWTSWERETEVLFWREMTVSGINRFGWTAVILSRGVVKVQPEAYGLLSKASDGGLNGQCPNTATCKFLSFSHYEKRWYIHLSLSRIYCLLFV